MKNGREKYFIDIRCEGSRWVRLNELIPFQGDLKTLSDADFEKGTRSLRRYGFSFPFFVWDNGGKLMVLDGHQRDRILKKHAADGEILPEKFPAVGIMAANEKEAKEKILLLTSQYGRYTMDSMYEFIEQSSLDFKMLEDVLEFPAFSMDDFKDGWYTDAADRKPITPAEAKKTLREAFGVPPFSVLDSRQGYWQDRKRAWLALGIRSEIGRGENLLKYSDTVLEPDPEKRKKNKAEKDKAAQESVVASG